MHPHFIGTIGGGNRIIQRCPIRIVGRRVYSPGALTSVRRVLRLIIDGNLNGGTNGGGFGISKGAKATRITRNENKCGSKQVGCLVDFYKCCPSSTPGCDYVITVRGSNLPTSKNKRYNPMFDRLTHDIVTRKVFHSIIRTSSSASIFIPSIVKNGLLTAHRILRRLNMAIHRSNIGDS